MRKVFFLLITLFTLSNVSLALGQDPNSAATEQAKREYRAYLAQLKELTKQYKAVTGEISKVLKEEGVPSFDEETGAVDIVKYEEAQRVNKTFGDADVTETDGEILVKVDLPGVEKRNIKVKLQDNQTLLVTGERDSSVSGEQYRAERVHGRFERRIELPAAASDKDLKAEYENGVLTVKIPKAGQPKKEVEIPVR